MGSRTAAAGLARPGGRHCRACGESRRERLGASVGEGVHELHHGSQRGGGTSQQGSHGWRTSHGATSDLTCPPSYSVAPDPNIHPFGKRSTFGYMTTVAFEDLRNHTADVLRQVADGAEVVVTVDGEPVALITRPRHRRRSGLPKSELLTLLDRQSSDPTLADDMAWISEGSTENYGDVR